jgi:hypothetical protein
MLRKLRVSQEVAGCPMMSLTCHPGGHHLIALARYATLTAMYSKCSTVAAVRIRVRHPLCLVTMCQHLEGLQGKP